MRALPRACLCLLLLALAGGALACRATNAADSPGVLAQPGWGRNFPPEGERATVRAVPASARPVRPEARLFRPGWGRN